MIVPSMSSTPSNSGAVSSTGGSLNACGPVGSFYNQKKSDWVSKNVDSWLNTWWYENTAQISANGRGFAGAFGEWAIGNPD